MMIFQINKRGVGRRLFSCIYRQLDWNRFTHHDIGFIYNTRNEEVSSSYQPNMAATVEIFVDPDQVDDQEQKMTALVKKKKQAAACITTRVLKI
jgi:hypothetical protein